MLRGKGVFDIGLGIVCRGDVGIESGEKKDGR